MRQTLASDLHLYVSPSGSDGNSGFNSGAALQSIQRAVDIACLDYDGAGFAATIHLLHGTWNVGARISIQPLGLSKITIEGDIASPRDCLVSVGAGTALSNEVPGTPLELRGIKVASWGERCLMAAFAARIRLGQAFVFGRANNEHILATNSAHVSAAVHQVEIDAGASNHIHCITNSEVAYNACPVKFTSSDTWFTRFVGAAGNSYVGFGGASFINKESFHGDQGLAHKGSIIDTGQTPSAPVAFLPGTPGTVTTATGGVYV
jgi:hypothetical protein